MSEAAVQVWDPKQKGGKGSSWGQSKIETDKLKFLNNEARKHFLRQRARNYPNTNFRLSGAPYQRLIPAQEQRQIISGFGRATARQSSIIMPRHIAYARKKRKRTGGYNRAPKVTIGRGFVGGYQATQAEDKKWETLSDIDAVVDETGKVLHLNRIAQGTGPNQRIGKKTTIHSLYMKFSLTHNDAHTPQLVRFALVWDKQPNGSLSTGADIFYFPTPPLPPVSAVLRHVEMNNRERFKILWTGVIPLNVTASGGAPAVSKPTVIYGEKYFRNMGLITAWNNPGAGIADTSTGALLWVMFSNVSTGNPNTTKSTMATSWRIRYTD